MNIEKYRDVSIVIIYDPILLDKVSIDEIKKEMERVSYVEKDSIILESPNKRRIIIQSTRLEITDLSTTSFSERDLSNVRTIIESISIPLTVKAFGINYKANVSFKDITDAGKYIADKFLKSKEKIEGKLGKTIFAQSIRIFYGAPNDFYDLRIFPIDFEKNEINVHFHYHRECNIADLDTLISEIMKSIEGVKKEFPQVLEKIISED